MDHREWLKDGGWRSRKLVAALFGAGLVFVGFCLAALSDRFADSYGTFCEATVAILAAYLTGNAVSRWGDAKHVASKAVVAPPGQQGRSGQQPEPEEKPVEELPPE